MLSIEYSALYSIPATGRVFCPYRICPLGAHVDHQQGLITGFALDRGIELAYTPTDDGLFYLRSMNYPGVVQFHIDDVFLERRANWGDFAMGATLALRRRYKLKRGFLGLVQGSLPVGGLSSSAAVVLAYLKALCCVNDIHLTQQEIIQHAIWVEHHFLGMNVGKLDQCCEVYGKQGHLLYMDTQADSIELVAQHPEMAPFAIAIAFTGVERRLASSAYNTRVDECKAAAYALKAYAGMDEGTFESAYLREVPEVVFEEYATRLPRAWYKRAKHFFDEKRRVELGVRAWRDGNIRAFGQEIFASGESSIRYYETASVELRFIHEIMTGVDGIYGARFSGAGFAGCAMAIIDPEKRGDITARIEERYLARFPRLKNQFSIHFCDTSDGIVLA